ncbi:MAG: hypothetical protein EPO13_07350 [Actinomycetota bacterium]|nr:MAG: hypothetical protein EPO13_07350 [Actinomycetota bacterium]
MTTIKATCPTCGDVDLTADDLQVTNAPAAGWATYAFGCPECQDRVTKPADAEVVRLLRGAGVTIVTITVPAEALESHHGAPIGYDDLLDFTLWLGASDTLVDVLLAEGSRQRS